MAIIFPILCFLYQFYLLMTVTPPGERDRTFISLSFYYLIFTLIVMLTLKLYVFGNGAIDTFMICTQLNIYVMTLQFLYSPTKTEIRKKYTSRLSNAQIAERAADHLANHFVNPAININRPSDKYNHVNDEIQHDGRGGRWSSAIQSESHPD